MLYHIILPKLIKIIFAVSTKTLSDTKDKICIENTIWRQIIFWFSHIWENVNVCTIAIAVLPIYTYTLQYLFTSSEIGIVLKNFIRFINKWFWECNNHFLVTVNKNLCITSFLFAILRQNNYYFLRNKKYIFDRKFIDNRSLTIIMTIPLFCFSRLLHVQWGCEHGHPGAVLRHLLPRPLLRLCRGIGEGVLRTEHPRAVGGPGLSTICQHTVSLLSAYFQHTVSILSASVSWSSGTWYLSHFHPLFSINFRCMPFLFLALLITHF